MRLFQWNCQEGFAYIRMPPDLLDDLFLEVASITEEFLPNLVCVLEAMENIIGHRELEAAFPQVHPLILPVVMDLLDPLVMIRGRVVGHMLLELDDV